MGRFETPARIFCGFSLKSVGGFCGLVFERILFVKRVQRMNTKSDLAGQADPGPGHFVITFLADTNALCDRKSGHFWTRTILRNKAGRALGFFADFPRNQLVAFLGSFLSWSFLP